MSILSNPINDDAIRESALISTIAENIRSRRRPYMGFCEDPKIRSVGQSGVDLYWKSDMLGIEGETLLFNKKRTFINGVFDWQKYGITRLKSGNVLIIENAQTALPRNIEAWIIYFNDCYHKFEHHTIKAFDIVFSKFWYENDGGLHDVDVECTTLKFNDPPKEFNNLTGTCSHIIIHCMDFADVPGLRQGLIKQEVNGKNIKQIKDVRAYFNNPKKYEYASPNIFFDGNAFIKAAGLDKLKKLEEVTIKDSGIEINFTEYNCKWVCSSIRKL